MKYATVLNRNAATPQSEPLPGRESTMVQNNAGGFVFPVTDETRLDRFLILGSESPTYYQSERKITQDNAKAVVKMVKSGKGQKVVQRVVEISEAGRAPKNDPALFVLAICAAYGDESTRRAALDALPKVARIGTHLFHFAEYVNGMRGWGRGLRNAIANWYESKPVDSLAYQAVKYQSRDGWSNRDLLRLAHPKTTDQARNALYKWIVDGELPTVEIYLTSLEMVYAFEEAKRATSAKEVAKIILDHNLPREAVPTQFLTDPVVWEALLQRMPLTAMIRNLSNLTKVGVVAPLSDGTAKVLSELWNAERIRRARVHPVQFLSALRTYSQGHGYRSQATWTPVQTVVDALDRGFYTAFLNVEPTGKNFLLALDVSGSMDVGEIAGVPGLTPREAAGAMALVTMNTEPNYEVIGFTGGVSRYGLYVGGSTKLDAVSRLKLNKSMRLEDANRYMEGLPFGATDCALPFKWAAANKVPVDTFIVYTDNETWAGGSHPVTELRRYREKMGRPAKSIVVAFTSTGFTIADPDDGGMLDVVGFDSNVPALIADFSMGVGE